ncbi:hypothetical protein FGF1_33970 [Flavobacteriaceae bacterium GF1]
MNPKNEKYHEELARLEARNDFEEKRKNKNSAVWTFLNSNFGLFLLTTVFIGGISKCYTTWKEKQDEKIQQQRQEQEDFRIFTRLSEETIVRLSVIESLKDTIPEFKSKNVLIAFWGSTIRDDKKLSLRYYHLRPFFTQYEKWTLVELITELSRYVDSTVVNDIIETKKIIVNNPNRVNGGEVVYALTKKNEKLPSGKLIAPKRQQYENWKYLTEQNKIIEISKVVNGGVLPAGRLLKPNKLKAESWIYKIGKNKRRLDDSEIPIVKYFAPSTDQQELLNSITKLKHSLTMFKRNYSGFDYVRLH